MPKNKKHGQQQWMGGSKLMQAALQELFMPGSLTSGSGGGGKGFKGAGSQGSNQKPSKATIAACLCCGGKSHSKKDCYQKDETCRDC